MINKLFAHPLYLVTDTRIAGLSHTRIVRRMINAGIRTIQLREKCLSKKDIYHTAVDIRKFTKKCGVVFIMNDYPDIALAVDADGVHLGQEDMPVAEARKIIGKQKIIGVSTHSLSQAIRAQEDGADYIGFGPMFHTTTKDAGSPRGITSLRRVAQHITIPIVAIGGITWENVNTVLKSGADATAVSSGILYGDIKANVKKFMKAVY
ncbi:MAG: thiamine phosphate synthase [Nitrospirota bacterium]